MKRRPAPTDEPMVSEQDRGRLEVDFRLRGSAYVPVERSHNAGRVLDFFETLAQGMGGGAPRR
ncbi:MAG: hypothetical protein IPI85_08800 [Dehalococcoidia bacterium]|nr:hypothetical protein [Dehalococcoidia bacterium]